MQHQSAEYRCGIDLWGKVQSAAGEGKIYAARYMI